MNDGGVGTQPPVLVVDDEDLPRTMLTLALRRAGMVVIERPSALGALEVIDREPISVVVCDVGMPGMSGIELVRALRRRAETATLPIILVTGSGDEQTVIEGLTAGADDFLAKPVRIDELIARVRAHLRTGAAWASMMQDELRVRAGVVAALEALTVPSAPEEAAVAVVRELSARTATDFVSVAQVVAKGRLQELATFNHQDGVQRGGELFPMELASYLLGRARSGPWVEEVRANGPAEPTSSFRVAALDLVASAPIYSGGDLVGLLSIGRGSDDDGGSDSQARLLAAAIDYASVLSAIAGPALAGRREAGENRARLEAILERQEFAIVYQPIVELETLGVVGYEALTRFADGVRPDLRFVEAANAGLGPEFEGATMALAVQSSGSLPANAFLSVNLSPATVIAHTPTIVDAMRSIRRPIVVEITEHASIDDYHDLRRAIAGLGPEIAIAVDDAGAGYASLRHVLELRPAFAKLDISLVRGIDQDDVRQGLAAGMQYFGLRTGCRLIAEGVETQGEADTLRRIGIDHGQGFLYGRPRPASELRPR